MVSSCAGSHYVSGLKKSPQVDEKKIGTNIVSKVERREHLKKSATLPNSVTGNRYIVYLRQNTFQIQSYFRISRVILQSHKCFGSMNTETLCP